MEREGEGTRVDEEADVGRNEKLHSDPTAPNCTISYQYIQ